MVSTVLTTSSLVSTVRAWRSPLDQPTPGVLSSPGGHRDVLGVHVNIDKSLNPLAGGAGLGPGIVFLHVDVANSIVRGLGHGIPGDDDFTGVGTAANRNVGDGRHDATG